MVVLGHIYSAVATCERACSRDAGAYYIYICLHTTMRVSSYYCMCVLILLYMHLRGRALGMQVIQRIPATVYMCLHTTMYGSSYYCMCPHTAIYAGDAGNPTYSCYCICVSSYYYVCVLILRYMCPHTTICVSLYYYIFGLILL